MSIRLRTVTGAGLAALVLSLTLGAGSAAAADLPIGGILGGVGHVVSPQQEYTPAPTNGSGPGTGPEWAVDANGASSDVWAVDANGTNSDVWAPDANGANSDVWG